MLSAIPLVSSAAVGSEGGSGSIRVNFPPLIQVQLFSV